MIRALLLILAATPAMADHPARLLPGDFVIMSHDWKHETDTWEQAGPEVATADSPNARTAIREVVRLSM